MKLVREPSAQEGADQTEERRDEESASSTSGNGSADGATDGRDDEIDDDLEQRHDTKQAGTIPFELYILRQSVVSRRALPLSVSLGIQIAHSNSEERKARKS